MIKTLYINICAAIIRFFMDSFIRTLKITVTGTENIKDNIIFAVWHQATFVLFEANPFKKSAVLTADGIRGDIFTKAVEHYNYRIIRTSFDGSKKEAGIAAIQLLKALREGYSTVIAIDGPAGPLFSVKPGVFFLSEKSEKKIVPVGVAASKYITLPRRWDRYFVPLPFSRVSVHADSAFNNDNDPATLKKAMFAAKEKAIKGLTI